MEVFKAIQIRRSVRKYKPDAFPEEKLQKILEAARLAPSAHNSQDWKFIVVKDSVKRESLAEAAGQNFISQAPVIIVAVGLEPEHILSSGNPAFALNLAIAIDHMTLAAVEQGLATCWIGAFSQKEVKKILNIPEDCRVVALLPLGFPADSAQPKSRKTIKEIISYDTF